MRRDFLILAAIQFATSLGNAAELLETRIASPQDGQPQRVRYYVPEAPGPRPLLVVLHTWSGDVTQTEFVQPCLVECEQRGWALIHPDFRGPNVRPEACASELAVQDVVAAVRWMDAKANIDPERRYVVGASGGGHMTLMMAGRHPELWAGASAWVPISDLAAWHAESVARKQKYAQHLEAVCGGRPGDSPTVDTQYRQRSPLTHLARAQGLPVDINAGINDGHTGSVRVSQSIRAFNLLADVNGQGDAKFTDDEQRKLLDRREIETVGPRPVEADRQHRILVRRSAGAARVTIFDGGHEGDMPTAIRWLAAQPGRKPRMP